MSRIPLKQLVGVGVFLVATQGPSMRAVPVAVEAPMAPKHLPNVIKAQAPLYPPILQMAHIDGVIRLRVNTDGERPSTVTTISGQPMLARAATESVMTWEFEHHAPTTFDTTFEYRLLESHCEPGCTWCGSAERPTVVLRLPSEVRVEAEEVMTCDPSHTRVDK